jgi:MOSC domain-containing protein YiiM
VEHLSRERLEAGLGQIRESPHDDGRVVLIVRRPAVGVRDLPAEAVLNPAGGLDGDNWLARGSSRTPDGSADPDKQITVMNARVAELVAGGTERMPLCGDQLYVDLDLSVDNLPAGSLLAVGQVVLRVSEAPHLGCAKFVARFGGEAMRFVNSRLGRQLRLRGMNARIVVPGTVRIGDLAARKLAQPVPVQRPQRDGQVGQADGAQAQGGGVPAFQIESGLAHCLFPGRQPGALAELVRDGLCGPAEVPDHLGMDPVRLAAA